MSRKRIAPSAPWQQSTSISKLALALGAALVVGSESASQAAPSLLTISPTPYGASLSGPNKPPALPMAAARSEADKLSFFSDLVARYGPLLGFLRAPRRNVGCWAQCRTCVIKVRPRLL